MRILLASFRLSHQLAAVAYGGPAYFFMGSSHFASLGLAPTPARPDCVCSAPPVSPLGPWLMDGAPLTPVPYLPGLLASPGLGGPAPSGPGARLVPDLGNPLSGSSGNAVLSQLPQQLREPREGNPASFLFFHGHLVSACISSPNWD